MDTNFFGGGAAPDPNANPTDFARAKTMAQMLMKQGSTMPQGQTVDGQFVASSPLQYANQLGAAALGGQQMQRLRSPGLMGGFAGMFGAP